jgi:Protein of unknown function (DUF2766).
LQNFQRRTAWRYVLIKKTCFGRFFYICYAERQTLLPFLRRNRYYGDLSTLSGAQSMSQPMNADQELVSDVVACQLVIKQILDVLDVIAPVEVREKMSSQLKNIDFSTHPAAADPVTLRAIQKAIALIELKFTPQGEAH